MYGTELKLATPDGPMRVYRADAVDAPRGAVMVTPEAFGLNGHIEDVTRRFGGEGFTALGIDIFHRSGVGTAPYNDMRQVLALFKGLTDDGFLTDVEAARAHLRDRGFADAQIGIVGFCFGARMALLAVLRQPLGAGVGFYGGNMINPGFFRGFEPLLDEVPRLNVPWLSFFGDRDESIPIAAVEQFRELLDREVTTPHEVVKYAEAGHAFHCDARPDSYHQASAVDAWQRTVDWLRRHLATAGWGPGGPSRTTARVVMESSSTGAPCA